MKSVPEFGTLELIPTKSGCAAACKHCVFSSAKNPGASLITAIDSEAETSLLTAQSYLVENKVPTGLFLGSNLSDLDADQFEVPVDPELALVELVVSQAKTALEKREEFWERLLGVMPNDFVVPYNVNVGFEDNGLALDLSDDQVVFNLLTFALSNKLMRPSDGNFSAFINANNVRGSRFEALNTGEIFAAFAAVFQVVGQSFSFEGIEEENMKLIHLKTEGETGGAITGFRYIRAFSNRVKETIDVCDVLESGQLQIAVFPDGVMMAHDTHQIKNPDRWLSHDEFRGLVHESKNGRLSQDVATFIRSRRA